MKWLSIFLATSVTKVLDHYIDWKKYLQLEGYQFSTINFKISALNQFFAFQGWADCRVKYLRIQRQMFRDRNQDLIKEEYLHLLKTAYSLGKERLELLMETICATGIRVSEVK